MIRNYLKTTFRNLWRNWQFTLINMAGLALGIMVFFLIAEFVVFERSANRYNKNYNDLYRVNYVYENGTADYYLAPGIAPAINQQQSAIERYVRVAESIASGVITYHAPVDANSRVFNEKSIVYADGNFLDVFSYPIISGTPSFAEPQTLAMSETLSRKLFGTEDAVGKIVTVSNQFGNTPYTVRTVYHIPENSDIKSEVVLSFKTLENASNRNGNDWADPNGLDAGFANIYLQLKQRAKAADVAQSITTLIHTLNSDTKNDRIALQSFSNLHLAPSFGYPYPTFGNLNMVMIFSLLSLLILAIAWANYINLSTSQAFNRAREVGVRKVLGANRRQLLFQYLTETFITTIISIGFAVLLVNLFQPLFNEVINKPLSIKILFTRWYWLTAILILLTGTLLSGGYVSFVLSAFKPVSTLKGKIQTAGKGFSLRKGLVVFQFTTSIALIISTIILYKQLKYMSTRDLGMNLDQLLVIKGPSVTGEGQAERNAAYKNSLASLPFIKKYSASNSIPGIGYNFSTDDITRLNHPEKGDEKKNYSMVICDNYFFDTYGISMVQGRTFNQTEADRSWNNLKKVVINETAAKQLGFDINQNIIGEKIRWDSAFEIIGVVSDYHHESLREVIKPIIYLASQSSSYFTIKTDTKDIQSKIAALKKIYNTTFPGNPFEYFFADERFSEQYFEDKKLGNVFVSSAFVTIFIACLGLFGLAAFSARQRTKEIGIRKVLGASVADISSLVSRNFLWLVAIAFVIASPIAWWVMHSWLQNFAYRTNINWWIFGLAGMIAFGIALLTISFQTIKAAIANPVKSLRTE